MGFLIRGLMGLMGLMGLIRVVLVKEAGKEVGATEAAQFALDAMPFLGFVPEEEHSLRLLFSRGTGAEDRLQGVGVITRGPHGRSGCHRGGCEVLHLFELEVHLSGLDGEFRHIFLATARMRTDEIWNDLLAEAGLTIDVIEAPLEGVEESERGLAHQMENGIGSVLGRHLQPSADMVEDEFAGIVCGGPVQGLVLPVVEKEVVAYATADVCVFDSRDLSHSSVDVE